MVHDGEMLLQLNRRVGFLKPGFKISVEDQTCLFPEPGRDFTVLGGEAKGPAGHVEAWDAGRSPMVPQLTAILAMHLKSGRGTGFQDSSYLSMTRPVFLPGSWGACSTAAGPWSSVPLNTSAYSADLLFAGLVAKALPRRLNICGSISLAASDWQWSHLDSTSRRICSTQSLHLTTRGRRTLSRQSRSQCPNGLIWTKSKNTIQNISP